MVSFASVLERKRAFGLMHTRTRQAQEIRGSKSNNSSNINAKSCLQPIALALLRVFRDGPLRLFMRAHGQVLDARNLPFETGLFDLVVDKGTVDAMLCDDAGKGSARYANDQS